MARRGSANAPPFRGTAGCAEQKISAQSQLMEPCRTRRQDHRVHAGIEAAWVRAFARWLLRVGFCATENALKRAQRTISRLTYSVLPTLPRSRSRRRRADCRPAPV